MDESHWTFDSCTQNLRACHLIQTQLNFLLHFTNSQKVFPRSLNSTGLVTLYSFSGISPFGPNWINLFALWNLYSLKAFSCRTVWIPLSLLYKSTEVNTAGAWSVAYFLRGKQVSRRWHLGIETCWSYKKQISVKHCVHLLVKCNRTQISNFMKIRPLRAELFRTGGQTWRSW